MKVFDPRVGQITSHNEHLSILGLLSILALFNNQQKEVRMPCGSKKPTTKKPPKK